MSHVREVNGLLRSGAMSPRHAPARGARTHGGAVARGFAIAVAVAGIGVGTWVLGSGPDARRSPDGAAVGTDAGFSAGALSVPGAPVVTEPPLSVAPAPPADAAAKRDALARATRGARTGASVPAAKQRATR
jgi:hypothetical protein